MRVRHAALITALAIAIVLVYANRNRLGLAVAKLQGPQALEDYIAQHEPSDCVALAKQELDKQLWADATRSGDVSAYERYVSKAQLHHFSEFASAVVNWSQLAAGVSRADSIFLVLRSSGDRSDDGPILDDLSRILGAAGTVAIVLDWQTTDSHVWTPGAVLRTNGARISLANGATVSSSVLAVSIEYSAWENYETGTVVTVTPMGHRSRPHPGSWSTGYNMRSVVEYKLGDEEVRDEFTGHKDSPLYPYRPDSFRDVYRESIRPALYRLAARIGGPAALAKLWATSREADALCAMSALGDPAICVLSDVMHSDANGSHVLHAAYALCQIGSPRAMDAAMREKYRRIAIGQSNGRLDEIVLDGHEQAKKRRRMSESEDRADRRPRQ